MDDVEDKYDRHMEGSVEILGAEPECTEETLHGEIGDIGDEGGMSRRLPLKDGGQT